MDEDQTAPALRSEPDREPEPPEPPIPQPPPPPPPPPPAPSWAAPSVPPVVGWVMPSDLGRPTIDVASIIGRSFDTLGREWSLFLVLALPAALGALLQVLIAPQGVSGPTSAGGLGAAQTLDDIPAYIAASIVSALLGLVSTAAIVVAADELWQGRAVGVTGAMARGLRALPRYLVIAIGLGLVAAAIALIVVIVVLGAYTLVGPAAVALGVLALLVVVPVAIFVSARLTLLAPVVILERNGIVSSIVRAWDLSRGHAILLFVLTLAVSICAGIPLWGGTLFATFVRSPLIAGIALAIATLVYTPLPAIAMVLAWGDRTGGRHRESEVMARGKGRRTAALLVFGLGAILFVAGFGVAAQAASALGALR